MVNKRASIKGRGVDILFGEKAPPKVDIEKLFGEEAELAEPEPELGAELEVFGEEVMAMEPVPPTPAEKPAPPKAREIISPPLEVPPSSEPRRVSVTLKVEEPSPPPVAPTPRVEEVPPPPTYPPAAPTPRVEEVPPPPTYPPVTPAPTVKAPPPEMPARRWEEATYGPPPPVAGPAPAEAAPAAPPGRPLISPDRPPAEIEIGGYLFKRQVDVGEEAGLPPGVTLPKKERVEAERAEEIPPQISREIEEVTVLSRLGEERQQALFKDIDALVVEAAQILSVDKGLEQALSLLREARDISIERPRQFDEAEYRVAKVRAMLERRKNSGRWSVTYGYPVLLYEVVFFLLLLGSLLFDHSLAVFIASVTKIPVSVDLTIISMEHIFPLWNTMAWGGIGGVVGSLYSLYWHAAVEQDFDRQYVMWYIVQPIMGVILGGIVYLIIAAGFISIQVLAAQAPTFSEAAQAMANPALKAFHSVVACVAGFRQRFVYEMLDRIVQVLTPRPKTKAELEAEAEGEKQKTG